MVGAPRLFAAGRHTESFGEGINALETKFHGHMPFILGKYLLPELVFKIFADDEHNLAKARLNGIVDGIVHDCFTVGAQAVQLLQATIAATHSCSEEN